LTNIRGEHTSQVPSLVEIVADVNDLLNFDVEVAAVGLGDEVLRTVDASCTQPSDPHVEARQYKDDISIATYVTEKKSQLTIT
jgi:hypothetical protein